MVRVTIHPAYHGLDGVLKIPDGLLMLVVVFLFLVVHFVPDHDRMPDGEEERQKTKKQVEDIVPFHVGAEGGLVRNSSRERAVIMGLRTVNQVIVMDGVLIGVER